MIQSDILLYGGILTGQGHLYNDRQALVVDEGGQEPNVGATPKRFTHAIVLEFDTQADLDYYFTKDRVYLDCCARDRLIVKDVVVAAIALREALKIRFGTPGCYTYQGAISECLCLIMVETPSDLILA